MPRIKTAPSRKTHHPVEDDERNDSYLDPEEEKSLREELAHVRHLKALLLRKRREDNERYSRLGSSKRTINAEETFSGPESLDEMSSMIATPASVSLMNGLDKAKNRFWFNIKKIEDKYAERERSGIPESLVEMDGEGNVYYPESMTALQQQSYINRMYQREIQFGKGSISAPQNSIDSFEGDVRAMREAKKSDQQFGRRFRKFHFSDSSGYDGEISLRSNSLSTGGMLMGKSEMLEDNVFYNDERQERSGRKRLLAEKSERQLPTMFSFFKESEESEGDEYIDEEEYEESTSELSDDEYDDNMRSFKQGTPHYNLFNIEPKQAPRYDSECFREPFQTAKTVSRFLLPIEDVSTSSEPRRTCERVSEARQMIIPDEEHIENRENLMKNRKITEYMKIIPKTELQNTSSSEKGPHQKDLKSATEIVEPVNPVKLTEKSSPLKNAVNKVPEHVEKKEEKPITISVRDDVKEMPKASENVRIAVKTPKQEPKDDSVEPSQKSPLKNPENSVKRTSPRLRERKAETPEVVKNEKPENHCHDFHKQGRSSGRRGANNKKKEPYCRHCELLEEEKKKEKKRRKTEGETSNEIKKKEEIKEISKKEKDAVEKQETPKRGRSGRKKMEQQGQSITGIKRRSATITPEEPQVKKKRLSDSDLISIPSSTAVVVDTELIAAENEHISIENLPKFAEKSDSQFASSIWNSPADAQLLEEVKKTASRKERKLFGVPLSNVSENKTMINVWVDNVDPNISDKDVFSNDLRRMMAQDKKARMDGKAGYGVRQ